MDMTSTIAPKSDQLNYDDLIGDRRITITITGVRGNAEADQPVSVFYDGDNGKPYKPCKSMRRVMVAAWGPDAHQYQGRSLTLYGDPEVKFGGIKVGGIRISHMTHIDRDMMIPLTVAKARRTPYVIKALKVDNSQQQSQKAADPVEVDGPALIARALKTAEGGTDVYRTFFSDVISNEERNYLKDFEAADPNDFDKMKPAHDVAKAIAAAADKYAAKNDESEY
jgi:hypothetical protein